MSSELHEKEDSMTKGNTLFYHITLRVGELLEKFFNGVCCLSRRT